jgi:hypothetical protein
MGDDNKKSFWTSLPGILTGIAAVIVAITGIVAAYNHVTPSPPVSPSSSSPTPSPSPTPSQPPSPPQQQQQQQLGCGTQPPGAMLFGSWRWSGTVDGTSESGGFTFNNDCTYTAKVARSGFTTNDEGNFLISTSPDASITLTNKNSGQKNIYLITKISENSFHASNAENTVNLDFFRAS